ncbi:MAG: ubiquinol-cytochrome C chaperone [Alphaproteobacteria bacterium]|jgi:cytochrome b pre-mRNA-processing protein 3|nr:ubiquinol-cytochrome C chaperone [Alphaproteobacteria bacterium]MBP9867971.1 ubiquinol-cytochrome C chaperone [Alphaproteobacteria bacterium]
MFLFPIRSSARSRAQTARQLYAAATKAARQPFFFREIGVPDTLEGRADMVFLHTGLLVCRLCRLGPDGAKLAQSVFDEMFLNYDWALREMGVGDLAVPRRIKKMMGLFKGQAVAYDESARASLPETKAALLRNVFSVSPPRSLQTLSILAEYVQTAYCALEQQSLSDFSQGRVTFGEFEYVPEEIYAQAA